MCLRWVITSDEFEFQHNRYFTDIKSHGLSLGIKAVATEKKGKAVFKQTQSTLYAFVSCNKGIESIYQCCNFFYKLGGHPLSTYAKFSEKLTFLTP